MSILVSVFACVSAASFLVFGAHALRAWWGLGIFYALLGGLATTMSWFMDAGSAVQAYGLTFKLGSSVFYTAILLGVFIVHVCDGPRATRAAILTVIGLVVAGVATTCALHALSAVTGAEFFRTVPLPSLRVNAVSVATTLTDLLFIVGCWEYSGHSTRGARPRLRMFVTLFGVMALDVVMFCTGVFWERADYLSIVAGTLASRFVVCLFSLPALYAYAGWQRRLADPRLDDRPVLEILRECVDVRQNRLSTRQDAEGKRRAGEKRPNTAITRLEPEAQRAESMNGIVHACAACRRIRIDPEEPEREPRWVPLEEYLIEKTPLSLSHGICPACQARLYPGMHD